MTVKFVTLKMAIALGVCIGQFAHAAGVAVVNGIEIPSAAMEMGVSSGLRQGLVDNESMRSLIRSELVNLEVISQKAEALKLDQPVAAKIRLAQARKAALGELLYESFSKDNPVKEDDLQREFDRQAKALRGEKQYDLRVIVTASKEAASLILQKAKVNDDFGRLAAEHSVDSSAKQGGALGWVLSSQVIPPIATVMVNLSAGVVSAMPIPTQAGWYVIKVDGVRDFVLPKFDDVKNLLQQNMMRSRWSQYVESLVKSANIRPPDGASQEGRLNQTSK